MISGYDRRELATIRVALRLYLNALDTTAQDFTLPRSRRAEANEEAAAAAAILAKLNREQPT